MAFDWIAIALGDLAWIAIAFGFGLLARLIGLPPLIGFLAAGFALNALGAFSGQMLEKFSDLGITLLLFTIGLKLDVRSLSRPQIWAVTSLHVVIVTALFGAGLFLLSMTGLPAFAELDVGTAALIAFALSFSSTVFVVKVLEERGETASLNGRIAIGVLIIQDIAAVLFLAVSTAKMPSYWAALLIVLAIPLRPLLFYLLRRVGHGELLVLFGLLLALGGAEVFELVQIKGDLGALLAGVLIASHPKADELNKTMMGFKDLFLLGFFLSIGMSALPAVPDLLIALALVPLIFVKGGLFFLLFTRFRLRARTSLLTSLNLTHYSEFGLIVAALAASNGWISYQWLVVLALALSFSFVVAALANRFGDYIHERWKLFWQKFQTGCRLAYDRYIEMDGARVVVVGMGGVGSGTYDYLHKQFPGNVTGVDIDPFTVRDHLEQGRDVILGDPSDPDFWDRVQVSQNIEVVLMALPRLSTTLDVLKMLKLSPFRGTAAAVARYPDEVDKLTEAGASLVFNIYSEAGAGFAAHVLDEHPLA
jgi:predicted Kef-type K+ transport protein